MRINVGSSSLLQEMGARIKTCSQTVKQAVETLRHKKEQASESLNHRMAACHREIRQWQSCIDNAEEDEGTGKYYEQLEKWQAQLHDTQQKQQEVDEAFHHLQSHLRNLESLVSERADKSQAFLNARISELEAYAAYQPDITDVFVGGAASVNSHSHASDFSVGYIPDVPDQSDWLWSNFYGIPPTDLSATLLRESFVGPAEDQQDAPQCVSFSITALKHHDEFCKNGEWLRFDPDVVYRNCKARDSDMDKDGTSIRTAFKVATKLGLKAQDNKFYYVRAYARLKNVQEVCHAVSLGKVVMLGMHLPVGISDLKYDSLIPLSEQGEDAHCMLIVGYDLPRQLLRLRNSWGCEWGDNGHCWMSFEYLSSSHIFDCWTSICEKVETNSKSPQTEFPPQPTRQVFPNSNYAWFDPSDIALSKENGEQLEWTKISRADTQKSLEAMTRLRPYLDFDMIKPGRIDDYKRKLEVMADSSNGLSFSKEDLQFLELYFAADSIRITETAQGGFDLINGRHRIYLAQQCGIRSVPVSINNRARKLLAERIGKSDEF